MDTKGQNKRRETQVSNATKLMCGYEDLANAIILKAVEDYRFARDFLKKHPHTKELERTAALNAEQRREAKAERKAQGLPAVRSHLSREELLLGRIGIREHSIMDVETFFCSDWFKVLSSLDGKMILDRLRRETE